MNSSRELAVDVTARKSAPNLTRPELFELSVADELAFTGDDLGTESLSFSGVVFAWLIGMPSMARLGKKTFLTLVS